MGIGHEYQGEKIFQGAAKQCHCVLFLSALPVFVARVKQDLRELRYLLDSADASSAPIRSFQVNKNYRSRQQMATSVQTSAAGSSITAPVSSPVQPSISSSGSELTTRIVRPRERDTATSNP